MNSRHATRDALLTYVRMGTEPRPLAQIVKYMHMMHGVKPGATREALYRLYKAGLIERDADHFYRIAPGALRQTNAPD